MLNIPTAYFWYTTTVLLNASIDALIEFMNFKSISQALMGIGNALSSVVQVTIRGVHDRVCNDGKIITNGRLLSNGFCDLPGSAR
jgi:hypothetical protein